MDMATAQPGKVASTPSGLLRGADGSSVEVSAGIRLASESLCTVTIALSVC